MVNEFCGFKHGVIGTDKMPADTTLNNMKKSDLIKLLHTAQHNYESLMWFYNNAVKANMAQLNNNGWIPCSVKMPPVETEVWIVAKRKWRDGTCRYITTTAMYEDGTVLENDSCWRWEDIEGEWNEEEDCYIIPEGWWENKHYNADGELNHTVDDEVIAWQPLPQAYQPKGE